MENNTAILNTINMENSIWIVYLFLICLSFIANSFEKKYYLNNDEDAKNYYRLLNTLIFTIAVVIYIYFFEDAYAAVEKLNSTDSCAKIKFNELNLIASSLILIAGLIFLYISIFDTNLDTEIAFS